MKEIRKPRPLAKPGGRRFQSGSVQIQLGVEADFRAAKKAHPTLFCRNCGPLVANLTRNGVASEESHNIPGVRRCHIDAPFGNRVEPLGAD